MNAADIEVQNRRDQLRKWIIARYANQAAFVAAHGLNQGEISALLKDKSFGSRKARNLEAKTGMPLRYLEQMDDAPLKVMEARAEYNVTSLTKQRQPVPLISWVQAGDWCDVIDNFAPGDAEEWLPCPRSHGARAFALRVRGVSMESKYKDGSIIFVDPDKQADHLSNVVVRMDDEKEATFKQLVIEGDKKFLRPLNPNWPEQLIQINGNATICGVVIGQFIPE